MYWSNANWSCKRWPVRALSKESFIIPSGQNTAALFSRQLFGADTLKDLAAVLQQRQDNAATPDPDLQLRQVLVLLASNQPEQARLLLESLPPVAGRDELSAEFILQQALVQQAAGNPTAATVLEGLRHEDFKDALPHHPLYPSLACSVLDLDRPFCANSHGSALMRLALVALVEPLVAIGGSLLWLVLLGRFLWSRKRSQQPPAHSPEAPLTTIPALLLFFFGGVVVLGNVASALAVLALRPWVSVSSGEGQALVTMVAYGAQALPAGAVLYWLRRSGRTIRLAMAAMEA